MEWQRRTELLLGTDSVKRLSDASVILFGVGGVGGYVAEALARAGIGHLTLVDRDTISESNRNRQLIALTSTIGKAKVEVMRERILDINPEAEVECRQCFYLPETADEFNLSVYDYVVDAVDTVTAKLEIITRAKAAGRSVISCMGTGNKLDPSRFEIADISKTSICPLAKIMRKELKKRGVEGVTVLFSNETPRLGEGRDNETGKAVVGSISYVPATAGLLIAGRVIRDLI